MAIKETREEARGEIQVEKSEEKWSNECRRRQFNGELSRSRSVETCLKDLLEDEETKKAGGGAKMVEGREEG